jgi:hypothetical protein
MKKYQLSAEVTVSAQTVVYANSLEEAIAEASSRLVVIGGLYSGEDEEENWIIEDADGSAQNVHEA